MMDPDCIFCKIACGRLPAAKIYEDADVVAVLDIYPACPGHVLVIPKMHYADVFDAPAATIAKVSKISKKIAMRLKKSLGAKGVNIINNSGAVAGQVIFHLHFHVIPRFGDDGMDFKINRSRADAKHLSEMSEKLRFSD